MKGDVCRESEMGQLVRREKATLLFVGRLVDADHMFGVATDVAFDRDPPLVVLVDEVHFAGLRELVADITATIAVL
jgi:hypothetical protein